jgi:DNA polymerase III subunit epsilon
MLVGQRRFEDMGAPLHTVPFCVLDLETTGATAADCEITEIGAVRYVGGEPDGSFQTLVDPGVDIPPFITVLTGITQAMVLQAPSIEVALPAFLEFIGDAVIVGHNVRFDLSFLNTAARRLGYDGISNRWVDTVGLARRLVRQEVRNLRLASLARHFRSPTPPTHRALDDARATAHVFFALLERAGTLGVTHLDELLALPTARGAPHYDKIGLADDLPRRPGVYAFRDRDGSIIYVGKAKNLRSRVKAYFYGDDRKSVAQMLRDLHRIEHQVCETELEAEVCELRLIGEHGPRYNRRSRPTRSPHWVKLTTERFPRLSMVRRARDDGALYLGPYRSRRTAEVVVHGLWDAVPIRRCTGKGSKRSAACSFAQLGVSSCPCDGSIGASDYAEIVDRLRTGIDREPEILLEPLRRRMAAMADAQRYEEAADLRDRYRAVARSLQRRRAWTAMQAAGTLWLEDAGGEGAIVDRGRLVAAWNGRSTPPLTAMSPPLVDGPGVPASVAAAEEAHLVWRWMGRDGVEIIDGSGTLSLPLHPVVTM